MPSIVLRRFFGQAETLFDRSSFANSLATIDPHRLNADIYRKLVDHRGFDMAMLRFRSIDARGHRIEAIRLSRPPMDKLHQVQVIGPFSKVSGLARASQISREALRKTDLDCVFTDFTMNNPQPDASNNEASGRCSAPGSTSSISIQTCSRKR